MRYAYTPGDIESRDVLRASRQTPSKISSPSLYQHEDQPLSPKPKPLLRTLYVQRTTLLVTYYTRLYFYLTASTRNSSAHCNALFSITPASCSLFRVEGVLTCGDTAYRMNATNWNATGHGILDPVVNQTFAPSVNTTSEETTQFGNEAEESITLAWTNLTAPLVNLSNAHHNDTIVTGSWPPGPTQNSTVIDQIHGYLTGFYVPTLGVSLALKICAMT